MAKKSKAEGVLMAPEMENKHVGDLYSIDADKHAKGLKNKKVGHKFRAVIHAEKTSHSNDMGKHRMGIRIHKIVLNRSHEDGETPEQEAIEEQQ